MGAVLRSVASVVSDSLQPHGGLAHQAPLSTGFSRQEHWSGVLLQRIFPTQGLNPGLPRCGRILHRLSPEWCLFGEPRNHFFISDRSSVTP